jgi:hypothetical protein
MPMPPTNLTISSQVISAHSRCNEAPNQHSR